MTRTARLMSGLPMSTESRQRQERRTRESQREDDSADRTRNGKKPYHVTVNWEGRPYGYGVTVWHDALAKVVRGLDPWYVDIRQQPHHNMEILMKRLDDDFHYSSPLNPSWLRQRIGNALSSYRHEIIKMIKSKQARPAWVKEAVWEKLVALEASEKFQLKSSQMRYANACRKNKGRTGPLGVAGITERLRQQLQRSSSPSEVFKEMRRDKGYSGRSRRANRQETENSTVDHAEGSFGNVAEVSADDVPAQSPPTENPVRDVTPPLSPRPQSSQATEILPTHPSSAAATVIPAPNENPLVQILERQIQELQSSHLGKTEDYTSLILTLQCRLDAMRHRIGTPRRSPDPAVEHETTARRAPCNRSDEVQDSAPLSEVFNFFLHLICHTTVRDIVVTVAC